MVPAKKNAEPSSSDKPKISCGTWTRRPTSLTSEGRDARRFFSIAGLTMRARAPCSGPPFKCVVAEKLRAVLARDVRFRQSLMTPPPQPAGPVVYTPKLRILLFGHGRRRSHMAVLMWGKKKKNESFTPLRDAGGDMPAPPVPIHQPPAAHGPSAPALKELVRKRLMTDMLRGFTADDMGSVMLVDNLTVRVLSGAYKLSELLEENINLVENITARDAAGSYLGRQPMPNMTACYFITPTVESINRMLADYKDKRSPMYGKCHVFLSSRLSNALLAKIKVAA